MAPPTSARGPRRHRWSLPRPRVRAVLLLGMLVPLVAFVLLAGITVDERWSERAASSDLEAEAAALDTTISLIAAVAAEEARSTVLGLATDFGDASDGFDIDFTQERARLAGARALVDARRFEPLRRSMDALDDLARLRRALDADEAGYAEVSEMFGAVNSELEARWRAQMGDIELAADRQPLTAELRARLRTLRESMEAHAHANVRIHHALDIALGTGSATSADDMVAAGLRYDEAVERVDPVPESTADAMWTRFLRDPGAMSTERTFGLAADLARTPDPTDELLDPAAIPTALTDGARWGDLLQDVIQAAARDLETAAADQVRADTGTVTRATVGMSLLCLLSLGLALEIARHVTRPARDLERAARRVERGELALDPVTPRGPRELTATVRAFNDMAATLTGVERRAVALAEGPTTADHDDVLPGRTGRALERALDRLRSSIGEADQQRVDLEQLATHDGLTGLLNRNATLDAVGRDLARVRRAGGEVTALYVDLDGLKLLNDTHGHAVGDEAIVRTAEALRATTRDGDVVGRLGGDEFLVVTAAPTEDGGAALAERVLAHVGAQHVDLDDGRRIGLRCSIGVARSGSGLETAEELVHTADAALYEAKRAGRGRVAHHEPDPAPPDTIRTTTPAGDQPVR